MLRDIERGITLGITIIGCIGSCLYVGYLLDGAIGTLPLFMTIGLLFGTVLAFSYLYHVGKGKVKK
ncbi:MAG: AtpZ/AtpI family protein [Erysipelotrichales bacterium]|nr:AtpZ/AtpI family protein [Erysipelotrichales bacterium]